MKYKRVILIVLIMFMGAGIVININSTICNGDELNVLSPAYKIEPDRPWNVNFSAEIDENTINNDTVKVYDENGETVDINIQIQQDKKGIKVSPKIKYLPDKTYSLVIGSSIKSIGGKNLYRATVKNFTVKHYEQDNYIVSQIDMSPYAPLKTITVKECSLQAATKYSLEGSSLCDIGKSISAFVFEDETNIYIYSSDGKLLGQGILKVNSKDSNLKTGITN